MAINVLGRRYKKGFIGLALFSPYLILAIIFWCIPFVWSFVLSVQKWNMMSPPSFVGARNFISIFSDKLFYISLRNTFQFIAVFIPLSITVSIAISWMIYKIRVGASFFLISFLLPYVTAGVAYAVILTDCSHMMVL